ncbi:MAG: DinB family protein [bacterium]
MTEANQRMLDRIEAAWAPFHEAVDQLGENALDTPLKQGWTAKELVNHVAFWDEAVEGAVTLLFRRQALPPGWKFGSGYVPGADWPDFEVHNAREAEWARGQTKAAVLARFESAHTTMIEFLRTVTDEELKEHADYFESLGAHHREHLAELQQRA